MFELASSADSAESVDAPTVPSVSGANRERPLGVFLQRRAGFVAEAKQLNVARAMTIDPA
jgi:hypothetical protein